MRALLLSLSLSLIAHAASAQVTSVAMSNFTACAVSAGAVQCWGEGFTTGNGSNPGTFFLTPQPASVLTSGAVSVSAGGATFCSVTGTGQALCWGNRGTVGDGTAIDRNVPTLVAGGHTFSQVDAGSTASCGVTAGGGLKCWGFSPDGQLGNGTAGPGVQSLVPIDVPGFTSGVQRVSSGEASACLLTNNGAVFCWGEGRYGNLGYGGVANRSVPTQVAGLTSGVTRIAVSLTYACAVMASTGVVKCWGQLPNGGSTLTPADVPGLTGVSAIAVGRAQACAIVSGGGVKCFGFNSQGNLGNGTTVSSATPVDVVGLGLPAVAIATSSFEGASCAALSDGSLKCWGDNQTGLVGDGTTTNRLTPVTTIAAASTSVTLTSNPLVHMGEQHSCSISTAGIVHCWGENANGQVGDGTTSDRTIPVQVASGAGRLAVGGNHTCILTTTGAPRCWGLNASGQLGDGTTTSRSVPTVTPGLGGTYTLIRAGAQHTCLITSGGAVQCVGANSSGQLGNGSTAGSSTAVSVAGLANVTDLRTGTAHTCALTSAGAVACWGDNRYGQLGDGTSQNRSTPVTPSGLSSGVTALAGGGDHTCAVRTGGAAVCWGRNDFGQLGTGSNIHSAAPVAVSTLSSGVQQIAAGGFHTCARATADAALCWGLNNFGQLGDGTKLARPQPVLVSSLAGGVTSTAAGAGDSCAVMADGGVRCWGENGSGQLGIGNLAERSTPQPVTAPSGSGYFDLTPGDGVTVPSTIAPTINITVTGSASGPVANVAATVTLKPEDVGSVQTVYVYALAPANIVQPGLAAEDILPMRAKSAHDGKDSPVGCVVAQLNSAGLLSAVLQGNLKGSGSTTPGAPTVPVPVLSGVPTGGLAGATFYVGYGKSPGGMFDKGTTTTVVTVPGSAQCKAQAPQKGWWWNPLEPGRGFSIEVQGDRLFMAAFLYDPNGRASWYVSTGKTTLDGASFTAPLLRVSGGQTLGGPYVFPPTRVNSGTVTLTFNSATTGTMVWPGGTVPIQRFDINPGGQSGPAQANVPESGWWWNPQEDGRGFFIEFQQGQVDIAGYMYDAAGEPIWYLTVQETPNPRNWSGRWWQYANGQTLLGPLRQNARINDNVAPLSIVFDSAETATLTLPNGRSTRLVRHRF